MRKKNANSFYNSLPEGVPVSNHQLRQVQELQNKIDQDPNILLSDKQKKMLQRVEK